MKFEENADSTIFVGENPKCFIYFLIYKDEVVYVGQTKNGLQRPFSHKDKIFDTVKLIYCEAKELDVTENIYIKKYKPIYNKELNYKVCYTMRKTRNSLEKDLNVTIYITDIKKIIKFLNIKTEIDYTIQKIIMVGEEYIKIRDFIKIIMTNKENFYINSDQKLSLIINKKVLEKAMVVFNGTKGF